MSKPDQAGTLTEKCRAFDVAALAEQQQDAPVTVVESVARLAALIDKLPQREAILDTNVRPWLERTLIQAEDRMKLEKGEAHLDEIHAHAFWHVRRASGIGGSEAGTVVKHFRDERGTFSDAHNLVLEKLLVLSPKPSKPEMTRGIRAEPWLQRMFLEQSGATRNAGALEKLKAFRWDRSPAMVGTPDDFVVMPNGTSRIIDYKAPSADVCEDYEKNGIAFDYVCQVHHYGLLAAAAGLRFKEMQIQVFDPRFFLMTGYDVPMDRDLAIELSGSCRRIWVDHVMTGVVPDAPAPDELRVEDEALHVIGVQAAMFKVIEDQAKERKADLISRISMVGAEWHDKATGKMVLPVGSFARQRTWDEEKLRDLAEASGVDPRTFESVEEKLDVNRAKDLLVDLHAALTGDGDPAEVLEDLRQEGVPFQRKLDAAALAAHLEAAGVSTLEAAEVSEKFTLTTKKKGPEAEKLSQLRDQVGELMESVEEVVLDAAPKIMLGQQVEPTPDV